MNDSKKDGVGQTPDLHHNGAGSFIKKSGLGCYIASLIVGLGMASGMVTFGILSKCSIMEYLNLHKTVKVEGFAEDNIGVDKAVIRFDLEESAGDYEDVVKKFEEKKDKILALLKEYGFDRDDIVVKRFRITDSKQESYIQNRNINRYAIKTTVTVNGNNIDNVKNFLDALHANNSKKSLFENMKTEYFQSKMPEHRYRLLSESIKDAAKSAENMLGDHGELGSILSITQNDPVVRDKDGHGGWRGGRNASMQKQIQVTTSVAFQIKN